MSRRVTNVDPFQPTPRAEEQGDKSRRGRAMRRCSFNPRPAPKSRATAAGEQCQGEEGFNPRPAPKSRATPRAGSSQGRPRVSTHAPLRRAGRPAHPGRLRCRLDVSTHAPLRRAGRPSLGVGDEGPRSVSTHAPLRRAGRPGGVETCHHGVPVSIHAPLRRAGRLRLVNLVRYSSKFQPTPRSEEQGDQLLAGVPVPQRVSTHAPLRRAGRRLGVAADDALIDVSTHAPLRRAGRPSPRTRSPGRPRCNPRPAPKSRATSPRAWSHHDQPVSTHAPLRRAGRPRDTARNPGGRRFNPRPAPKSRATSWVVIRRCRT